MHVYCKFGFRFELQLSTRPEKKFLGDVETWSSAEKQLANCLTRFCDLHKEDFKGWTINAGDGAFYGPKIDIKVFDSLKREHQCATIQLDFQLPQRFELQYTGETQSEIQRPVMIHRAIYGSFERFIAILCEHFGWYSDISKNTIFFFVFFSFIFEKHNKHFTNIKKKIQMK